MVEKLAYLAVVWKVGQLVVMMALLMVALMVEKLDHHEAAYLVVQMAAWSVVLLGGSLALTMVAVWVDWKVVWMVAKMDHQSVVDLAVLSVDNLVAMWAAMLAEMMAVN